MTRALVPVFFGALARRRAASLLSVLAIALGVALGLAVQLIHDAALEEFGRGMRSLSGSADLQVSGPRSGFDDALFETLALHPLVAEASPLLEVEARIFGREESVRLLGVDVLRLAAVQPALLPQAGAGESRFAAFSPGAVFPSAALAERLGLAEGAELVLQSGLAPLRLRVAGSLPGLAGQALAVIDIAAAQHHFAAAGRLTRIDLRLAAGVGRAEARASLARLLPAGVVLREPEEAEALAGGLSRAYRVNLTMLAVIALLTGGFLVFSTQALSVARRQGEFAFLRALGLARRELLAWVLAEGALLGLVGGLLGSVFGYGFAQAAFRLLGGDLGAGYFEGLSPRLAFDPGLSLTFVLFGAAVGLAGAWAPARLAARVLPAAALKAGGEAPLIEGRGHPRLALASLAAAALVAQLPPQGGIPLGGYAAIALLLAGGVLALGRLAGALAAVVPGSRAVSLRLARARLQAAPGYAVVAGAGVLASCALAVAMAVMVASFRHSVDDWLERVLPAELYVRAARAGVAGALDPEVQRRLLALPGVRSIDFLRHEKLQLDGARSAVALIARPVSPDGRELPLVAGGVPVRDPVWISEAVADLWRLGVGDALELPLAGGLHRFTVAGVWRDYARQTGALVLPLARYRELSGDLLVNDAAVHLADAHAAPRFEEALHAAFGAGVLEVARPGEIRRISLTIFDRTFAITYLLEAAAVMIGLAGVAASFAALAAARRREFGMLRHLGLTRAQIGAMIACEGALTAGAGALGGLAIGAGIAVVLVEVVNRQSFHWSMDYQVPVAALLVFIAAMVLLAAGAAALAGRQAMQAGAVLAVREDW